MAAALIVWSSPGVLGQSISSVVVTPDPLAPGQEFTLKVAASEELSGAVFLDLRPTADQVLRFPLTFTPGSGGDWVAEVTGKLPAGLAPAPGAQVTFRVIAVSASGGQQRATKSVGLSSPGGVTMQISPDPLSPGASYTVTVNSPVEVTGALFVDLRPTKPQTLRYPLTFTAGSAGGWTAEFKGKLAADLTPPAGAGVTFRAFLTRNSGGTERLTRTVLLQGTAPDTTPPEVKILSPADGSLFATAPVSVNGTTSPDTVTLLVNGVAATLAADGTWSASIPLVEGLNSILAEGTDAAGNKGSASITVTRDTTAPQVAIVSPADGSLFATATVSVSGTSSPDTVDVVVNGVAATLSSDGTWSASIPLVEGLNSILADGTDAAGNKGSAAISVRRDMALPFLAVDAPADGAVVNTRQPAIQVSYSDAGSGLDLNSFVLELNGADVTSASTVGPAGATYQPTSVLPTGENQIKAAIKDLAGNQMNVTTRFTVAVFRAIADCAPTSGQAPLTVTFRTRGEFTGGSIVRYRWDFENDGVFDTSDSVARDLTHTYTQPGTYVAVLEVQNNLGELATDSSAISVTGNPPEVYVQLIPSNGAVPLAVQFQGYGLKRYGAIAKVEFDFEGDGTFDLLLDQKTRPKPDAIRFYIQHADCYEYYYGSKGQFSFHLNDGLMATAATVVGCQCNSQEPMYEIRDPEALSDWDEHGGNTLKVSWLGYYYLYVSYIRAELVYGDQTVKICMHDLSGWDCRTRGLCNSSYSDSPFTVTTALDANERFDFLVDYTYDAEGIYSAIVRVTDNEGFTATASATATVIRAGPPGSPSVTAVANPTTGFAPLVVNFNGSATDDGSIVFWEWDFDGDGMYDYSSPTSPATAHTYTEARNYVPALRVTDDSGLSSIDTVDLSVDMAATLSVPNDTFTPALGQQATIRTTISAPTNIRLFLKDRRGNIIRDLANEFRAAGTYDDVWDGTDNQGLPLAHGPYYALLQYRVGSIIRVLDLTASTGGTRYNPPRNTLYDQSRFRPYEDQHLYINFNVNQGASEITAFVGLFNTDTRFVTLLEREPFGAGTYQIKWDGLDANGNFAKPPPGDSFLFGIWGYIMPDNTVFLISAPNILNVKVDPNFFDPSAVVASGAAKAVVTYDLDKAANVELTVTRLDNGRVLRRIRQNSVAAGTGRQIEWDGRADNGILADKGDYRLGLVATDSTGSQSITRYALVRVFY